MFESPEIIPYHMVLLKGIENIPNINNIPPPKQEQSPPKLPPCQPPISRPDGNNTLPPSPKEQPPILTNPNKVIILFPA